MSSSSGNTPAIGSYQIANIPISLLIFFGMWVCYTASQPGPMPFAIFEPLKTLGLLLFQSEWGIGLVFWGAVLAHVYEAILGFRFAWKVKRDFAFIAYWTFQTFLVGFPSLKLIKEQRRLQLKAKSQKQ